MRNIKIVVEYDGLHYFGFQRQPRHKTIQGELEKALSSLLNQKTKIQAASGRTDSGVSASGQIVNFCTDSKMEVDAIRRGLNALLPRDIAIKEAKKVSDKFHARYSAKSKTYEYLIWNHPIRSPLHLAKTLHIKEMLNIDLMKKAAKILCGRHDFKSFCAADPAATKEKNKIRTITKLIVSRRGPFVRVRITADGFLYKMVRNLVGTLVDVGLEKITPAKVEKILLARDRGKAGRTVPGEPLTLLRVTY